MTGKDNDVFADVFSKDKNARTEPEIKAPEAPVKEPETPPEPAPAAQQEATVVPPQGEPPPQNQQLSQEEYLALRRAREEAKETKTALEIERLKAANYERELAQFRQQQQQRPKEPAPDIYENPEGYRQHIETQYEARLTQMKLEQSEFLASRDYGAELVGEVKQWAARLDDARAQHLLAQASPFHAAVEAFRQEKAAAQLKEHDYDLEKLKAKWLAELQAQQAPAGQQAPQSGAQNLPPKIAGAGGGLGKAPTPSEDTIFRSVFSR